MDDPYQKIVDTVPLFFFIWDLEEKKTTFISGQFYDHRSKNNYVPEGSRQDLRRYIHQNSQQAYDDFFEKLNEDNDFHDHIELKAAGNLPGIEWMELKTYPVKEENRLRHLVVHLNDITRTRTNLRVLQEQVDSLDAVTFMLAHELSMPVSNIMGLAEYLKASAKEETHSQELHLYDMIYNFGGEILTLSRGLISLIELQLSRQELRRTKIAFKPLLKNILEQLYLKARENKIEVRLDEIDNELEVALNIEKFSKAVEELLVMLLKYSRREEKIYISAQPFATEPTLRLDVLADKVKLPEESIRTALNRDGRLNLEDVKGRQINGIMELIIAKEIIQLHKGQLSFILNDESQGFRISLPL
ncbi:MAG: sensor histidine kinase [Cyclobacteriaceae bacterium]